MVKEASTAVWRRKERGGGVFSAAAGRRSPAVTGVTRLTPACRTDGDSSVSRWPAATQLSRTRRAAQSKSARPGAVDAAKARLTRRPAGFLVDDATSRKRPSLGAHHIVRRVRVRHTRHRVCMGFIGRQWQVTAQARRHSAGNFGGWGRRHASRVSGLGRRSRH